MVGSLRVPTLLAAGLLATACAGEDPPTHDRLSVIGDMPRARVDHSATLLPDGRVLIVGGDEHNDPFLPVDLYDPSSRSLEVSEVFPPWNFGLVLGVTRDGLALVGNPWSGYKGVRMWAYDPGSDSSVVIEVENLFSEDWPAIHSLGDDRWLFVSPPPGTGSCSVELLTYEPDPPRASARTLSDEVPFPCQTPERMATADAGPDRVLMVGFWALDHGFSDMVAIYDLATEAFTLEGPMAAPREPGGQAVTLASGDILLVGGSPVVLERFNPETGAFTAIDSALAPHTRGTATSLPDGRVLITGGAGGPPLSQVALYDPQGDELTILDLYLSPARAGHVATALEDGRVLLSGGGSADGRLTIVDLFE